MPESFSFVLPGNAVPKGRPRLGRGGNTYTPAATRRFEKALREVACLYLPLDWRADGIYRVDCLFAFSDHRHRDADNLAKSALDPMIKLAFDDDHQVHDLRVLKAHGDANPRTEVTVTRIGDYVSRAKALRGRR